MKDCVAVGFETRLADPERYTQSVRSREEFARVQGALPGTQLQRSLRIVSYSTA
jgi:hypothetical protein